MTHSLGYARISTVDQNPQLQLDELAAAGCFRTFVDQASGALDERRELANVLDHLRPGDTLVVWRLDRLGRSLRHLIDRMSELEDRGVGLRSLHESIDTTTAGGKLVFHIFGAMAEFERDLLRERTMAGLAAARARGRKGGRPRVMNAKKVVRARDLYAEGSLTVAEIAAGLKVSRSSIYRYLGTSKSTPPATSSR